MTAGRRGPETSQFGGFIRRETMNSDEHRSIGQAMRRAHQVTSIAMELAVPAGLGAWFDHKNGTSPLWTIVGALIGSGVATLSLRQLIRNLEK